ncbi:MAG: SDR family oxidoreductase [Anaerolineae bacterium]|nr:SDR family oxidoreductase [Anaerolineae bacterium]
MTQPLKDKIAVVTGGGGGIGSAICRRLAAAGMHVVITYSRSQDNAEAVARSLPGENHLVMHCPVDDSAAQARLAQAIAQTYGTLDILVNNAGITRPVPHADLESLDDDLIDSIFRVNVRGTLASVRALKDQLLAGDGGLVVNISSIAARTAVGSNVAYCASKAAIDNFTMSLARALAPKIRVVSVAPGWVNGEYAQRMPPEYVQQQRDLTPLRRIAEAEDVAEAIYAVAVHLPFTTGAIIPVDGGRPLT